MSFYNIWKGTSEEEFEKAERKLFKISGIEDEVKSYKVCIDGPLLDWL